MRREKVILVFEVSMGVPKSERVEFARPWVMASMAGACAERDGQWTLDPDSVEIVEVEPAFPELGKTGRACMRCIGYAMGR